MQLQTGNLLGTVTDQQGGALPGVTIILQGGRAPQVQVTDAVGQFRFLDLMPGDYTVKAQLEGFSTVEKPATVSLGRNTQIGITMQPAITDEIPLPS